jgi:hypothetical protein
LWRKLASGPFVQRIVRMTSKIVADAVVTLSKTLVFDSMSENSRN